MGQPLYFDGKKFISSKRASELANYTQDYIGQLIRGKKLEARMIGRSWYVSENSLLDYQRLSISGERVKNSLDEVTEKNIISDAISAKNPSQKISPVISSVSKYAALSYSSDERSLIPEIKKYREEVIEEKQVVGESAAPLSSHFLFHPIAKKLITGALALAMLVGGYNAVNSAYKSGLNQIAAVATANVIESAASGFFEIINSIFKGTGEFIAGLFGGDDITTDVIAQSELELIPGTTTPKNRERETLIANNTLGSSTATTTIVAKTETRPSASSTINTTTSGIVVSAPKPVLTYISADVVTRNELAAIREELLSNISSINSSLSISTRNVRNVYENIDLTNFNRAVIKSSSITSSTISGSTITDSSFSGSSVNTNNLSISGLSVLSPKCLEVGIDGSVSAAADACGTGSGITIEKWATSTNGMTIYPNGGTDIALVIGGIATTTDSLLEVNGKATVVNLVATNASTTNLIISGLSGASIRCLQVLPDGTVGANASGCGGGGGSGGGSWSTTTSSVAGELVNYPNNTSDIIAIGAISTTSAPFWFDPNISKSFLTSVNIGNLNGPIQANNGLISATTSIGVLYGGTGLSSAPSFGNILLGNSSGGYSLTSTSSLGFNLFGKSFEIDSNGYLAPTTSVGIRFPSGFISQASSTNVGNFTITGNATATNATTTNFAVSSIAAGSLIKTTTGGSLVSATAGTDYLTLAQQWATTSENYFKSQFGDWSVQGDGYLAPTTTRGILLTASSTVGNLTINGNSTTTNSRISGTLSLASLTGPLQAISGVVSASSTLSVFYGGTGLSTLPTYGQILLGNSSSGYTLTSTSSLGFITTNVSEGTNLYYQDGRVQTYLDTINKGNFYSSTSADYWLTTKTFTGFSTSSADYYASQFRDFSVQGNGYLAPTTTRGILLTASSTVGNLTINGNSTTTNATTTNLFSTTASSTNLFATTLNAGNSTLGLITSGLVNGQTISSAANFSGTLSITNLATLTGGFLSSASSTLQNFTALNGTTSNATTTSLAISGITSGSILKTTTGGAVVSATAGTDYLTLAQQWATTSENYFKSQFGDWSVQGDGYLAPTTTRGIILTASSTVGNLTINGNSTTTNATTTNSRISGTLSLASLTGPLQAISGVVSASSTLSVFYGGTGLSTLPTYGQILLGNSSSGYTLTSTSSLGFNLFGKSWEIDSNGYLAPTTSVAVRMPLGFVSQASSTINGNLTINGNSTTTNATSTTLYNSGTAILAATSGNVGIGTTNPGSLLEVNGANTSFATIAATGQLTIRSTTVNSQNAGPSLVFRGGYDGGTNWSPYSAVKGFWDTSTGGNANGGLALFTSPATGLLAERMRVDSAGNVGIGTTSPYRRFSVDSSSGGGVASIFKSQSGGHSAVTFLSSGETTIGSLTTYSGSVLLGTENTSLSGSNGQIEIKSNNDVILGYGLGVNTGNVGIGTASPSQKLQVTGAVYGEGDASAVAFYMQNNSAIRSSGAMYIDADTSGSNGFTRVGSGDIIFRTAAASERMRIMSGGNVGIGSTNPLNKLVISNAGAGGLEINPSATIESATGAYVTSYDRGASAYRDIIFDQGGVYSVLKAGGGFGIGTTAPSTSVQAFGSAVSTAISVDSSGQYSGFELYNRNTRKAYFNWDNTASVASLNVSANAPLAIFTNDNERMRITAGGNVGINKIDPGATLTIKPISADSGIHVRESDDGATAVDIAANSIRGYISISEAGTQNIVLNAATGASNYINNNGKFGIGTTTPWGQLSINPNALGGGVPEFVVGSSTRTHFIIDGGGNVGVGTTSPVSIFEVVRSNSDRFDSGLWGSTDTPSNALTITNTNTLGTESTLLFRITNSEGKAKTVGGINFVGGVAGWGPSTASQVADMQFLVRNSSATLVERMLITNTGNVGIGTSTPGAKLNVIGALCVDDATPTCANSARTAGTIYSVAALSATLDLAESYPTKDVTLVAGEIVELDPANSQFVRRATTGSGMPIVGIVSTNPGFWLGGFNDELFKEEIKQPIALSGRVPLKVSNEGGSIAIGDRISLSSVAGVGMRQTGSGETVGIALEASNSTIDTIEVFVELKHQNNANHFTIDSNGNVGVGTTTPGYKMHVIGDVAATSFVNISTRDAKTDIQYLGTEDKKSILEKIKNIGIAEYHYNSEDPSNPLRLGLIAEEAPAEVLAVGGKGVDIYKMSTFILAGVQEMNNRFEALEETVANNTSEIESIKAQLASLVALASSTTATSTQTITWSNESSFTADLFSYLATAGLKLENGIAYIREAVFEKISANLAYIKDATIDNLSVSAVTVGGADQRAGITLYDQLTGEAYCLQISGGQTVSTPGKCGENVNTNTPTPMSEPVSSPAPTNEVTPEPAGAPQEVPVVESTGEVVPETVSAPTPETEPAAEPVAESPVAVSE